MSVLTPSGEQLVILLNETFTPPTIFADANISFGTPTPAPEGATDYDTVVIGTGTPGRGYYGTAEIHYTRCPLSNLAGLVNLYSMSPFTLDSIVSALNAQFATFLADVDLQTPTIPTIPVGGMATVTLTADPSSIGWEGSVDITLNYGKPFLPVVIGNNHLATLTDGLTGLNGAVSGISLLFDIDFTSYRDALKVKTYNPGLSSTFQGFTDFVSLSNVCKAIGLPAFTQPQVYYTSLVDYATSAVPNSNQNFDRVVVLNSTLGSRYYPGPVYFHYNLLDNR